MPSLRQLECSLVLGSQGYKLPEYKLKYNDNSVECHIPTPDVQLPFSVHIVARGYHAPGLAAFVFIDGEYQCNRNQVQSDNIDAFSRSRQISAELRLRQKEEKLPDGTFIGREWTFSELKGGKDKSKHHKRSEQSLGTIEVVILRCHYGDELRPTPVEPTTATLAMKKTNISKKKAESVKDVEEGCGMMMGLFDGTNERPTVPTSPYYCAPLFPPLHGPQYPVGQPIFQYGQYHWSQPMEQELPVRYAPMSAQQHEANVTNTGQRRSSEVDPIEVAELVAVVQRKKAELKEADINHEKLILHICQESTLHDINFAKLKSRDLKRVHKALKNFKHRARNSGRRTHDKHRKHADTSSDSSSTSSSSDTDASSSDDSSKDSRKRKRDKKNKNSGNAAANITWEFSSKASSSTEGSQKNSDKSEAAGWGEPSSAQDSSTKAWLAGESSGGEKEDSSTLQQSKPFFDTAQATQKPQEQRDWTKGEGSGTVRSRQSSSSSSSSTASPNGAIVKPYWSKWRSTAQEGASTFEKQTRHHVSRSAFIYPALPAPTEHSRRETAADRGVQIGEGAAYQHKARRPTYIDTMDAPYAVFTFKYCSRAKLEELLGRELEAEYQDLVSKAERMHFMAMSKEDMADELMRLSKLRGESASGDVRAKSSKSAQDGSGHKKSEQWTDPAKDEEKQSKQTKNEFVPDKVEDKTIW